MPLQWLEFFVLVAVLLLIDLLLLQRDHQRISTRMAWVWTGVLALIACGYALYLGFTSGSQHGIEFISGYLIEGSLSVDNLFVFLVLFRSLRLGSRQQHRVLLWGVIGAIILRGLMILAGITLLDRFAWVQYLFGAFLAFAAVRLALHKPETTPAHGPIAWVQRCCLRYVHDGHLATASLLLVIGAVEFTDLIFAIDSIPAVLAVTRDPWIAFTSNIFAVLGLRSLYFALSNLLDQFHLLHYGLACILAFVAFKMLAVRWIEIPALGSLAVILAILALFAILSKILPEKPHPAV